MFLVPTNLGSDSPLARAPSRWPRHVGRSGTCWDASASATHRDLPEARYLAGSPMAPDCLGRRVRPAKGKARAFEKPFADVAKSPAATRGLKPRSGTIGTDDQAVATQAPPLASGSAQTQTAPSPGVVVVVTVEHSPRVGTGRRRELLSRSREGSVGQRLPNTRRPR